MLHLFICFPQINLLLQLHNYLCHHIFMLTKQLIKQCIACVLIEFLEWEVSVIYPFACITHPMSLLNSYIPVLLLCFSCSTFTSALLCQSLVTPTLFSVLALLPPPYNIRLPVLLSRRHRRHIWSTKDVLVLNCNYS